LGRGVGDRTSGGSGAPPEDPESPRKLQQTTGASKFLRARWPEIAEPDSDLIAGSFALPEEALAEVGQAG